MIFLDTETTGLSAGRDQILELAIVAENGDTLFNGRFRPTKLTSWNQAQRIHGITPEDVKDCPTIRSQRETIQNIIDATNEIVGYNTYYDIRMLIGDGFTIENKKIVDVMEDFAEIYGEWNEYRQSYKWQKLTTCANFYHFDWNGLQAHGALADTLATRYCYFEMLKGGVYDRTNNIATNA